MTLYLIYLFRKTENLKQYIYKFEAKGKKKLIYIFFLALHYSLLFIYLYFDVLSS